MSDSARHRSARGAEFLERLQSEVIVADGAMGTAIYEHGFFINQSFDSLCLTRPALIAEIHRGYLDAGAEVIETNTFGANRARLLGHGLEDRVAEINAAAVRIAREEAGDRAYVAGSIGPIGVAGLVAGNYDVEDLRAIFEEQAGALLEERVDLLVLETIPSLQEMEAAVEAVRGLDSDIPLVGLMTFADQDTQAGETPEEVVDRLSSMGVDVVGANCSVGPRPMLDCIRRMRERSNVTLAAMPNAGLPQSVEGRLMYMASSEYFGKFAKRFVQAGVRLLGGCCGTTPDHVRHMKLSVSGFSPIQEGRSVAIGSDRARETATASPVKTKRTKLAKALATGSRFVTSVELTPPKSADLQPLIEAVAELQRLGVDAVNIPEYARISPRVTPLAIAAAIRDDVPIEAIIHYCCRDRNLYGMQADLMAARALEVRDVLIVTGDPPKAGPYSVPTAVFDVDSIGLVRVANGLSQGFDAAGRETGVPLELNVGVGVNPGAIDLEREVSRFRNKIDAGAEFAMTQPVFDPRLLEALLIAAGRPSIPVLVGILPLYSHRNAEFLHNEVPGMHVPDDVRSRMAAPNSASAARELGVEIAREALAGAQTIQGVQGAYVMPPFGRYDLAVKVLEGIL